MDSAISNINVSVDLTVIFRKLKNENFKKNVSFKTRLKDFFGLYALTPFENDLIEQLKNELSKENRVIFENQLSLINSVERYLEPSKNPFGYGWTFFRRIKFKKSILHFAKPFPNAPQESFKGTKIGKTRVSFDKSEINVTFKAVDGIFCSIEYRSPDKIYYPSKDYVIEKIEIYI